MMLSTMTGRSCRTVAVAAALLVATAGAAQVQGDSRIDVNADGQLSTRSQIVRTDDLNVAVPAGQARLDLRLRVAARTVCQDTGMWGLRPPADFVHCYDKAIADARGQLDRSAQRQAMAGGRVIRVAAR